MIPSSSGKTPQPGSGSEADKLLSPGELANLRRRLEVGPFIKFRCTGGYHFKVVESDGKLYAVVPCSHKWCKKGGASANHVYSLATGILVDHIYEDAAEPREILDNYIRK
jgi:hypothetical protein